MSKCNIEIECNGAGKCCLECLELCYCDSVCETLDKNASKIELQKIMENCDRYEK